MISTEVDMHSHLIPGIDDGCKSMEESLEILAQLEKLGYKKAITTPHIHSEYYPNTRDIILDGLSKVKSAVSEAGFNIEVEAAAEYYIDANFLELIKSKEPLLTFGEDKYILVETPFMNKPLIFDEVIFQLKCLGMKPVLAHPERYTYLIGDISWLKRIKKRGVYLQLTISSLVGMYGRSAQKIANQMLKENLVDFLGTDIHRPSQLPILGKAMKHKIIPQNLNNGELI